MIKIYTKQGDKGITSMLGGKRVSKSCLEMEAIGEVDELNAFLGILIEEIEEDFKDVIPVKAGIQEKRKKDSRFRGNDIYNKLINIQHCLFVIGANLASVQAKIKTVPKLKSAEVKKLEKWIDKTESELPKLTNFILPGGSEESAKSFYARAICRRAERRVIDLSLKYQLDQNIMKYLNRLSDLLFVLGRWFNFKNGIEEVKWKK